MLKYQDHFGISAKRSSWHRHTLGSSVKNPVPTSLVDNGLEQYQRELSLEEMLYSLYLSPYLGHDVPPPSSLSDLGHQNFPTVYYKLV